MLVYGSNLNKGDLCGIIHSNKGGVYWFFGFGTYQGREIPSKQAPGEVAELMRRGAVPTAVIEMLEHDRPTLYGCHGCWESARAICDRLVKATEVHVIDMAAWWIKPDTKPVLLSVDPKAYDLTDEELADITAQAKAERVIRIHKPK